MAHELHNVQVPHFSFPFRLSPHGHVKIVEQDSDEEIMDCVEVLLSTPLGSRQEVPRYGLPDQTFLQGGADIDQVSSVVHRWEPRAEFFIERDGELKEMVDRIRVNLMEKGNG